jgi:hypothetical protein
MLSGISDMVVNRLIIKEKRNNNLPERCPKLSDVARTESQRLFGFRAISDRIKQMSEVN